MRCVQRQACPRPINLNLLPPSDSANQLRVMELVRSRIGRFKSPIVLQILKDLDGTASKAS